MTLGRRLHRALLLSAVLAISHLGCGGSEGVKKPSTTGVYTPSEKGEDQIRVTAVAHTSRRAPETAARPEPAAPAPVATAQPTAEPANATKTAAADDDEPADEEPAAEPAPDKPAKSKKSASKSKSKKHHSHRSKKHHK